MQDDNQTLLINKSMQFVFGLVQIALQLPSHSVSNRMRFDDIQIQPHGIVLAGRMTSVGAYVLTARGSRPLACR